MKSFIMQRFTPGGGTPTVGQIVVLTNENNMVWFDYQTYVRFCNILKINPVAFIPSGVDSLVVSSEFFNPSRLFMVDGTMIPVTRLSTPMVDYVKSINSTEEFLNLRNREWSPPAFFPFNPRNEKPDVIEYSQPPRCTIL